MSEDYDRDTTSNVRCSSILKVLSVLCLIIGIIMFLVKGPIGKISAADAFTWLMSGALIAIVVWGFSIVVKAAEKYLNQ